MAASVTTHEQEPFIINEHKHLLCWKSTIAGLAVTLMIFVLLSALGAGIAGFTAEGLIDRGEGGSGFTTGAGLWLAISVAISLSVGSYFAVRISRYVTNRI